jgi:hypothetical protein
LLFSLLLRFLAGSFAIIRTFRQQAIAIFTVIASEAKQSNVAVANWIASVAALLAMTAGRASCRANIATPYSLGATRNEG